jgi:hypothetical protein
MNPNLLVTLPQSCREQIAVAWVMRPTGEGHLPLMKPQRFGPLGEHEMMVCVVFKEG